MSSWIPDIFRKKNWSHGLVVSVDSMWENVSKKREKCSDCWEVSGHHGTPGWWFYHLSTREDTCPVIEFPGNLKLYIGGKLRQDFATKSCHWFGICTFVGSLNEGLRSDLLSVSNFHFPNICSLRFYDKSAKQLNFVCLIGWVCAPQNYRCEFI